MADPSVTIDVSELEKWGADLEAASHRIGADTAKIIRDTATQIHRTARERVPVDTGALRDSITITVEGDGRSNAMSATIGTSSSYAAYVEYGTAFSRPQPFMAPALDAVRDKFQQALRDAVEKTP